MTTPDFLPYNPQDEDKGWCVVPDYIGGTVVLNGPCGLSLMFSKHVCVIDHYTRWITFIRDIDCQMYFRNITYELLRHFNGKYAIYLPDSGSSEASAIDYIWDDENKDIEFIKLWLLVRFGNPRDTISELDNEDLKNRAEKGYFIDYFKDFEGNDSIS